MTMFNNKFHSFFSIFILAGAIAIGAITEQPAWAVQAVVSEVASPTATVVEGSGLRQDQWLKATPDQRILLAEKLGEDGARRFAGEKGWRPIMDGTNSTLRQGFDQVYRAGNVVHVIEAKGGGSPLGFAYGYPQGSPQWAVKAAERTLLSQSASAAEREAARAVLRAAQSGNLYVHVVRTSHVLGEPGATVLQQTARGGDEAARFAKLATDNLANRGIALTDGASRTGRTANAASNTSNSTVGTASATVEATGTGSRVARFASRATIPVLLVVDSGLRVRECTSIERQFADGELTQQQRETAHTKNAAGMVGGWSGAITGAKLGGMGGVAAGSCVVPGPGTVIGGCAGAVAGGVAGYLAGEAAAEAAAEWTMNKVHDAGTTVAEGAGAAWDGTKNAAGTVGDAGKRAWRWAFGD